jgi:thioredoxin-related protein
MKKLLIPIMFLFLASGFTSGFAQEQVKLYDPAANAKADIKDAVARAKAEGRHVFLQIGGNWCGWCREFHKFTNNDADLKKLIEDNFVVVHVNWSPENKNEDILARYGFPQRFGFPVFVILDGKGKQIHTQDSGLLELEKSYDKQKVATFFKNWTPKALDPNSYKK